MPSKIMVVIGGSEGRMGRIIQDLISKTNDIEVLYGFDPKKEDLKKSFDVVKLEKNLNKKVDVYVDFTTPDSVLHNVKDMSQAGIDSIIGTTGWYEHLEEMKRIAINNNRRILYSPNFSLGVNVLFHATSEVARILGKFGYDAAVYEIHHSAKVDAPSGTAIALGNILLKELGKNKLAYERRDKRSNSEVDVLGLRVGRVTGTHEILFTPNESYSERLILQHDAFTPEIFGVGVLTGIRWLTKAYRNKAGLYTFSRDVLGFNM